MRDPRSQPAENDFLYLCGTEFVVVGVNDSNVIIDDGRRRIRFSMESYIQKFNKAITSIKEL